MTIVFPLALHIRLTLLFFAFITAKEQMIQFAAETVSHSLPENSKIQDIPIDEAIVTKLEVIPEPVVVKDVPSRHIVVKSAGKIQSDDLMLTVTPDGKCIGIKVKYGMPDSFDTELGHQEWLIEAGKKAVHLKDEIESGARSIDSVKDQLDINPHLSPKLIKALVAESRSG